MQAIHATKRPPVIRHHLVPPADPRVYRGEAVRDLTPPINWLDEILIWSLIACAVLGLLAVCGWVVTVAGAWA